MIGEQEEPAVAEPFYGITESELKLWESDICTLQDECSRPSNDEDIKISVDAIVSIRSRGPLPQSPSGADAAKVLDELEAWVKKQKPVFNQDYVDLWYIHLKAEIAAIRAKQQQGNHDQ